MIAIIFLLGLVLVATIAFRLRNSNALFALTAVLLGLFPFYNSAAYNSCEGGCNIRIDLLLVLPVLAILILMCARLLWLRYRNRA